VIGDIDAANGLLRITSAGHPPPLLLRQGQPSHEVEASGLPIGIDPGACYTHAEIWLQPSDTLLLYSDGLMDCENNHGQQYGLDLVRQRAEEHTGSDLVKLLSQLESDLDEWRSATPLSDDLSMLLLNFNPNNVRMSHATEDLWICQSS